MSEHTRIRANQLPLAEKQLKDVLVGWVDSIPFSWEVPLLTEYYRRLQDGKQRVKRPSHIPSGRLCIVFLPFNPYSDVQAT